MYSEILKLPLKGARLIAVVMSVLCCVMMIGTAAFAASSAQTVELGANGSEAELVMDFPQAAAEEIASMQISLVVSASSDSAEIEFIPDSGLPAKIVESRYHSDTGVLTVYLAGTKALFSESSPLTVGRIRIGDSSVSASVGVKEGSIKFVRGSELVTPSGDVAYPNSVTISTGGVHVDPPSSSAPSSTTPSVPSSAQSSSSSTSGSSNSADTSEPDEPVMIPVEPADTSSLADAVDRAGGYKRGDYTEESFAMLTEALNKAKAVLSNKGVSQDEVDEALLVLENAIGMLTSANNAPSGTDGYGSGGDNSPSGFDNSSSGSSDGSGNSSSVGSSIVSPEKPSDNSSSGQTVSGEQSSSDSTRYSDTDTSESSENESSDNNTVMWILIVMAVLAVAAGVLIVMIKLKKK